MLFHRNAVQLDVGPCRVEDKQLVIGRPLEEGTQVVPVRVERSPAIARAETRQPLVEPHQTASHPAAANSGLLAARGPDPV